MFEPSGNASKNVFETTDAYRDAVHAVVTETLIQFDVTNDQLLRNLYIVLGCTPKEAQNYVASIKNKKVLNGTASHPKLARPVALLGATIGLPEKQGISTAASRYMLSSYTKLPTDLLQKLEGHKVYTFADLTQLFRDQQAPIVEAVGHAIKITNGILNVETGHGIIATKAWTKLQKYFAQNEQGVEIQEAEPPSVEPLSDQLDEQPRPTDMISQDYQEKLAALKLITATNQVTPASKWVADSERPFPIVNRELTKREIYGPKIRFPERPTHMDAPHLTAGSPSAPIRALDDSSSLTKIAKLPKDLLDRMARCGLQTEGQLHNLLKSNIKNLTSVTQYKKKILSGDILIKNSLDFNVAGEFLMGFIEQQEERKDKEDTAILINHEIKWEAPCQVYQTAETMDAVFFVRQRERTQFAALIGTGNYLCPPHTGYVHAPLNPPAPTHEATDTKQEPYIQSNQPLSFNQTAKPDAAPKKKEARKNKASKSRAILESDDDKREETDQIQKRFRRARLSFDISTSADNSYKRDVYEPEGVDEKKPTVKSESGRKSPSSQEVLSKEVKGFRLLTTEEERTIFDNILASQEHILSIALSLPDAREELKSFYNSQNTSSRFIDRSKRNASDITAAEQEIRDNGSVTVLARIRKLINVPAPAETAPDRETLTDLKTNILDLYPTHAFWKQLREKLDAHNHDDTIADKLAQWDAQNEAIHAHEQNLVGSNMKLVFKIVNHHYLGHTNLRLDLINEGNLGILRAARKFNPHLGWKFSTYATWWINQHINRYGFDTARDVRQPVHVHESLAKLYKANRTLKAELKRDPTDDETADELGLTVDQVRQISSYRQNQLSLDADSNGNEPEESGQSSLSHFLEGEAESPEDICAIASTKKIVREVLGTLTPREEKILRMRYGIDETTEYTLDETGKALSVSRERIRQIEVAALKKLRHPSRGEKLSSLLDQACP